MRACRGEPLGSPRPFAACHGRETEGDAPVTRYCCLRDNDSSNSTEARNLPCSTEARKVSGAPCCEILRPLGHASGCDFAARLGLCGGGRGRSDASDVGRSHTFDNGLIAGTLLKDEVRAYLGIPIAAPPVPGNRWPVDRGLYSEFVRSRMHAAPVLVEHRSSFRVRGDFRKPPVSQRVGAASLTGRRPIAGRRVDLRGCVDPGVGVHVRVLGPETRLKGRGQRAPSTLPQTTAYGSSGSLRRRCCPRCPRTTPAGIGDFEIRSPRRNGCGKTLPLSAPIPPTLPWSVNQQDR